MVNLRESVGRYGIWSGELRSEDAALRGEIPEAAAELEELGFGAVWLGGSSGVEHAVPLIEAARLADEGRFSVRVASEFSLADAAKAHEISQGGHAMAKIILRVTGV